MVKSDGGIANEARPKGVQKYCLKWKEDNANKETCLKEEDKF